MSNNLDDIDSNEIAWTNLSDIVDMQKGFAFKSSDYKSVGVPLIRVSNFTENSVGLQDLRHVNDTIASQQENVTLKTNDVIIATVGSWPTNPASIVGKVVRTPKILDNSLLNQNAVRLRVKNRDTNDQIYLYYLLKNNAFSDYIVGTAQGSASQASIMLKDIKNYKFLYHSKDYRKKIVGILSSLDKKIELNNEINKNLEEQAQAILKNFISGKEKNGVLSTVLDEMQKSKIKVGDAKKNIGEYPFYTSGVAVLQYNEYLVEGRNIFLNTGGIADVKFHIGKAAYSTDTWCIKGKNNLSDYLYLLLSAMIEEINLVYFEGSALKHLQKQKIKNLPIYIPNAQEIDAFNSVIYPLFDKISKNKTENETLTALRDSLLPKLMKGEI